MSVPWPSLGSVPSGHGQGRRVAGRALGSLGARLAGHDSAPTAVLASGDPNLFGTGRAGALRRTPGASPSGARHCRDCRVAWSLVESGGTDDRHGG